VRIYTLLFKLLTASNENELKQAFHDKFSTFRNEFVVYEFCKINAMRHRA